MLDICTYVQIHCPLSTSYGEATLPAPLYPGRGKEQRDGESLMTTKPYFDTALFAFLEALHSNNNREWFQAHKQRYEREVRDPMLRFIGDFGPRLWQISRRFVADARPNGHSLFRIHRDVRFAQDKRPYKTNAGAHFRHEAGRDAHAPGFYLHLEPGMVFIASGVWHPARPHLTKIR